MGHLHIRNSHIQELLDEKYISMDEGVSKETAAEAQRYHTTTSI